MPAPGGGRCRAISTFDGAQWIWFSREPMPSSFNFPGGTHYFRGVLQVPEDAQIASAELIVTADNLFGSTSTA